jgi:signal peptidase I
MLFTRHTDSKKESSLREKDSTESTTRGSIFSRDVITFALIVLLIVLPIRLFVAQPFIVNGSSMEPTFENGEYLIVDEFTYRLHGPERGDVIVFNFPNDPKKFFIKRIIGLPGETVALKDGVVRIITGEHPDGFSLDESYVDERNKITDTMTVELDQDDYFVMGDNRNASFDSRAWGPLDKRLIVGRAFLRLFPLNTIALLPGNYEFE